MTQIKMIETRRGSPDGHTLKQFIRDHSYDVPDTLARAFIGSGWAVLEASNEITSQMHEASRSTITQGELLTIIGKLKHVYPDARIFNPQNGGNHAE